MPLIIALIVTAIAAWWFKRLGTFAAKNFNTQAFVAPESVPTDKPDRDTITNSLTMLLMPPQAQVGSGTGEQMITARLAPSLPPVATFGNQMLDSTTKIYSPARTG